MKTIPVLLNSILGGIIPGPGAQPIRIWCLAVGLLSLSLVGAAQASDSPSVAAVKAQIVTLLKSMTMTMNYFVDEKFCRQFFKDFQTQKNIVHVQPMIQADRYDDPALAAFVDKCPKIKWVGAEPDEEGVALNTITRDQFGNRSVSTTHFRLYKVDINNNRKDGAEHVFYSDGFVPEPLPGEKPMTVEELNKTYGWYVVVDFEHCLSLGGVEAGRMGMHVRPVYHGIIQYRGRSYIYVLDSEGGYKLYLNELTTRRETFKTICRYWQ